MNRTTIAITIAAALFSSACDEKTDAIKDDTKPAKSSATAAETAKSGDAKSGDAKPAESSATGADTAKSEDAKLDDAKPATTAKPKGTGTAVPKGTGTVAPKGTGTGSCGAGSCG